MEAKMGRSILTLLVLVSAPLVANAAEPQLQPVEAEPQLLPPLPTGVDAGALRLPGWLVDDKEQEAVAVASDVGVAFMLDAKPAIEDRLPTAPKPGDPPPATSDLMLTSALLETTPGSSLRSLLTRTQKLANEAHSIGDFNDLVELCNTVLESIETTNKAKGDEREIAGHAASDSLKQLAAWAYNRRGELRDHAGDHRQAFDDFQQAILYDAECWAALHNRGVTLAQYGKLQEALDDFGRVIELNPRFATAYRNRAEALANLGQTREALDNYTAALSLAPGDVATLVARGVTYQQLGQFDRAVQDLNEAVRRSPGDAAALTHRGNIYAQVGFYEQALVDFESALRIDPHSVMTYRSVAWLLSTCPQAKFRDAGKALESARRAQHFGGPHDPVLFDTLATALAAAGRFEEAVRYEQQALLMASPELKTDLKHRLQQFRNHVPYRQPARQPVR